MFFLKLDFGAMLPSALLGMLLAVLAFALVLFVLQLCGFRLLWRRRSLLRREKSGATVHIAESKEQNELSEEELIVILTAAATEALDKTNTKRFRVVAFRRT